MIAGLLHRTIGTIKAVDDVTLDIAKGEILGVVGESGCGKSNLARLILRLIEPTSGTILFDNQNICELDSLQLRQLRRKMQTEDRGQKTEDRGQRTEDRGQRTEDRGQRTEVRGQRTEVRGQRSEDRGQSTENRGQKSECGSGNAEFGKRVVDSTSS